MLNIILIGLVSFFSDISAEMVYPLIPLYLVETLGATPSIVGIIEGLAESMASLLKVFSGYVTDKYKNKKPVAFIGYSTGIIYKVALVFAGSWIGILGARVVDRVGKGIRTAPRDALVCESADGKNVGRAFGMHKALDMAGAAIGILFAYFLLVGLDGGSNYKKFFLISIIPAVIGLGILLFVREKKTCSIAKPEKFWKRFRELDKNLKLYLLVAFIFTLGNSSNTFLLLRAKNVGFNTENVILLYFVYNITASLLSIPFGKISDKIGRKKVLTAGYLAFSVVYLGFAFVENNFAFIGIFILYGVYVAMTAGVERAFISEVSPADLKGTMLGLHSTIVGIALLPASIIAGLLWDFFGAKVPFVFGAGLSLLAALILIFMFENREYSLDKNSHST